MKPALTVHRRGRALIAGAVGYGLWATGSLLVFGILILLIGALLFGAFFGGVSWLFGEREGWSTSATTCQTGSAHSH